MASRKHNEFLETGDDEDDNLSQGYNSEDDGLRKGSRSLKRRKVDSDEESGVSGAEDILSGDDTDVERRIKKSKLEGITTGEPETRDRDDTEADDISSLLNSPISSLRALSKKNLIATETAIRKSGVVYLSRIPPFMKPHKLRSLLEPFGTLNRIFLTPEDPTSHSKRVRNGGNKKRSFVDGWVEFTSKKDAKKACELLNARTIGGKKGSYYADDVWNLLYLKGFKWHNLTEQIAAEDAERASRMRVEISKTTRENREFVANVERSKKMEGMKAKEAAKKRRKQEDDGGLAGDTRSAPTTEVSVEGAMKEEKKKKKQRPDRSMTFKQTAVVPKKAAAQQSEQVKSVLSKIF